MTRSSSSSSSSSSNSRTVLVVSAAQSLLLLLLSFLANLRGADAVLPKLALDVVYSSSSSSSLDGSSSSNSESTAAADVIVTSMFLSHALFGAPVKMRHQQQDQLLTVTYPPDEANALLCHPVTSEQIALFGLSAANGRPFLIVVPRGDCTFETKAANAQLLGAAAVIVYGSLASRYSLNNVTAAANNETTTHNSHNPDNAYHYSTTADILYPQSKFDYDCDRGSAWIDAAAVVLDDPLPYNAAVNDAVLAGTVESGNLCWKHAPDALAQCASKSCLLTGQNSSGSSMYSGDPQKDEPLQLQACCAWDLHIWLYPDDLAALTTHPPPQITIPVAYMTAAQAATLFEILARYEQPVIVPPGGGGGGGPSLPPLPSQPGIRVVLYARWRPKYNTSAVLIWLLGSTVAALAAYLSAVDYRSATARVLRRKAARRQATEGALRSSSSNEPTPPPPPPQQQQQRQPEEVLELTAAHAAGFIVMASTSLLVLFYFKIYGIVKVFYAFGCSTAVSQVILYPLYTVVVHKWAGIKRDVVVWRTGTEDFGDITVREIVTHAAGFGLGFAWLFLAFTVRDAENLTFFWVMQDVFGSCMCITFLKVIRLNSIRVASILLIVAFFYDIFFVFVTPYLFQGKSVMITVATSGGPPKADALWCEKYPDDRDCQGGNPLPMLLAIPKLFDFMGGSSLLGLGDIVLPGLLLSFAARFDAAKALLGVMGGGRGSANQSYNCPEQQCFCSKKSSVLCKGGYFAPLVVAYAIGLAMANTAVYVMNMGQPALLYLVPCCLGTMVYIGWRRQELQQLWDGPRVLRSADDVVFGQHQPQQSGSPAFSSKGDHTPLPVEEGNDDDDVLAAPPSAADEDDYGSADVNP